MPQLASVHILVGVCAGQPVGGGEAGALLAVYSKLANVEEALAQSRALGTALSERLQANEQQLQAMGVQVRTA